jgi:hypothetical protein
LCAASQAQPVDSCADRALATAPWARLAQLKAQQAQKSKAGQRCPLAAAAAATTAVDKTPPVVTAFNAETSFDAADVSADMGVSFKTTDDLSGLRSIAAGAHGPSGQQITVAYYESLPRTKASGLMLSLSSMPYLEPGTYTFDGLYVTDLADNTRFYDAAAIAALGNSSFIVKNKRGFDTTPPTLTSGRILTPQVSLSATQPGTKQPRYVGVEIEAVDHGNTATSGFLGGYMTFCLLDNSGCITLETTSADGARAGAASATVRFGTQLTYSSLPTGDYHIASYHGADRAGNWQDLDSQEFGGETDFSQYFPSLVISIKP